VVEYGFSCTLKRSLQLMAREGRKNRRTNAFMKGGAGGRMMAYQRKNKEKVRVDVYSSGMPYEEDERKRDMVTGKRL